MAHLPPHNVPEQPSAPQSKTLFLSAPGILGKVVTERAGKFRSRDRRFANPHAALDWCISKRISFVYTPVAPDPSLN